MPTVAVLPVYCCCSKVQSAVYTLVYRALLELVHGDGKTVLSVVEFIASTGQPGKK